jgi:hypothetical protein
MSPTPQLSPDDVAAQVLDFSDAEFAAAPRTDVHAREVRLLETDFIGIAIGAQRRIETGAQSALPIAIASRYDGERDWDLPFTDNCLLVASSLDSGQVLVAPGLVPPKALASRGGYTFERAGATRPPPEQLEGAGAQITWTEATCRMELPWQSGRWTFGLIYFDWLSNLVSLELVGASPAAPASGGLLAVRPAPAVQAADLPTYLRVAKTPPQPAAGASFDVALDTRGGAQRLMVHGAFATPARKHTLVSGAQVPDGGSVRPVAALIPITLLLVGANTLYPWRRDLVVPVYGAPAQEDQRVEGALALDALAGAAPLPPGAYACYLVLDGAIHGPKPVHVTP